MKQERGLEFHLCFDYFHHPVQFLRAIWLYMWIAFEWKIHFPICLCFHSLNVLVFVKIFQSSLQSVFPTAANWLSSHKSLCQSIDRLYISFTTWHTFLEVKQRSRHGKKEEKLSSACASKSKKKLHCRKVPNFFFLYFSLLTQNMYMFTSETFFRCCHSIPSSNFHHLKITVDAACIHHAEKWETRRWEKKRVRQSNKFMCSSATVLYDTVIKCLNVNHLKCSHVSHLSHNFPSMPPTTPPSFLR